MISFDPETTAKRFDALQAYVRDNVLDEQRRFKCGNFRSCLDAASGKWFFPGQLFHVGKQYDAYQGASPRRVVIIGQEYGSAHIGQTLSDRYDSIMYSAHAGWSNRNPHMKGTTSTLRSIWNIPVGTDAEGEYLHTTHLFDTFALVNSLMCSCVSKHPSSTSGQGAASWPMYMNCGNHLRTILEILDPTVIVVQNVSTMASAFKNIYGIRSPYHVIDRRRALSVDIEHNNRKVKCFFFAHPSASGIYGWWGQSLQHDYLTNIVSPWLNEYSMQL